ncbi:hypothetical protein JRQ81_012965 [Phrynocephalus forsythii]|uniref:CE051 protein n=1 Tax=Phrynocephalus forsythii TaxID=171643 RepID=A0A9Q1B4H4_9SAUR|nr:hypothetical protein JRQ81_012965 [Phrynocephalus forsythii]
MAEAGVGCRLEQLQERLSRCKRDGEAHDTFLTQAAATLERLTDLCKEPGENCTLAKFLPLYTQALLDITYFEENQLVDEDFPEEYSLGKVEELINALSEPELLVIESRTAQEPLSVLGVELLECLYWRRGALLYMFCHTVKERKEWLTEKTGSLKKLLDGGVHYLVKMLGFRSSGNPSEECLFEDANTAKLVCEGVFSDTHLLAMMYCGEMCYWGLKCCGKEMDQKQSRGAASNDDPANSLHSQVLDFRETGEKMVQKYITVCEGPLKSQNWDTKNAKRILDFFQHLAI